MIDIENEVFQLIYDAVKAEYPEAIVRGEEVLEPSQFPCVSVVEASNYPYHASQDSASYEHHVNVIYEIQIFTNKTKGRKTQAKDLFRICDDQFARKGFVRTMKYPLSLDDATKYRIVGRYSAVVGENHTIYRRG